MSIEKLRDNIYWIGVKDPELKVFDIIMNTKKGTTYNSYLIDDEKVAVIDTVKDGYFEEFLSNIKSIIGDRSVDYIIVQHTELDHSGSLIKLIQQYPNAKVIASKAGIMYSKNITNSEFNYEESPTTLNLGKTTLKFIYSPNLHWPDTMFTYAENEKVLFTCDFMGAHYCPENKLTDDKKEDYLKELKYYFDCIMGPFKKFVRMGLNKIEALDFTMVAPSHGPIHTKNIDQYIKLYTEWSEIEKAQCKNIPVFYISAYGNTEKVAKYLSDKINEEGINSKAYEITSMDMNDIVNIINKSSGFLIGSPTINQDAVKPAWDVLSLVSPIINRGKAAAAFGSYGWSGEAVPMMTQRLKALKLKTIDEGFKFKFVPSCEDYHRADNFIKKYLELLK